MMTEFDDDLYEERAKVLDCGCVLIANLLNHDMKIVYCPTHAAAHELYECLLQIEGFRDATMTPSLQVMTIRRMAKYALTLVDAEETE